MTESSRLGPFALEEKLSGSDRIYRAVHVEQRRQFALKLFSAPFGTAQDARMEFAREWAVLKKLKHPHILRCFGGGLEETNGFLVYELFEGESLQALMQRRGKLPWEMAVELGTQICEALEYAHEKDLVHQALTPDKILISPNGNVKVTDFRARRGENKAFESVGPKTVERFHFIAPEQIRGDSVSEKTDLYLLGCLLYLMLTGRPPFEASSVEELEQLHVDQPPERVSTVEMDCPVWLDRIVASLLEKSPSKRPHTVAAVRLGLKETKQRMAAGTGVLEHAAGGLSALPKGVDKSEARKLLGRKERELSRDEDEDDETPFYEKTWFLVGALALIGLCVVWAMWPPSERQLFERAQVLLESGDEMDARQARDEYLEPLLARFPDGEFAEQAQAQLDEIEMGITERQLRVKLRLGRQLETEQERLLAEAWKYEQFGDRITAFEKYQAMVYLLEGEDDARIYMNLARRRIAELMGETDELGDRVKFIEARMQEADKLYASGEALEAQKIWRSIVNLYGSNRELKPQVAEAQKRLDNPEGEASEKDATAEDSSSNAG